MNISTSDTVFAPLVGDVSQIISSDWDVNPSLVCISCPDFRAIPLISKNYNLSIVDVHGCFHQLHLFVDVSNPHSIFTPNVFSPNNDGINDEFKLYSNDIRQINKISIYDRWGAKIYMRNNILYTEARGWDGTFKGKDVVEGVYVYFYEVEMNNGKIISSKGSITVIR